ncbi:hypothetical protein M3924_004320 [Vibrio fluvialis]|nr:hypothetical protein [Vibrio fluvialis]
MSDRQHRNFFAIFPSHKMTGSFLFQKNKSIRRLIISQKSHFLIRAHSVFVETFEDGSVCFAAKKKPPLDTERNIAWAKAQKNTKRPLVDRYLKFDGVSRYTELASGLSQEEAHLIKDNLVKRSRSLSMVDLNMKLKIDIELTHENIPEIQHYCSSNRERAGDLVELFNSI